MQQLSPVSPIPLPKDSFSMVSTVQESSDADSRMMLCDSPFETFNLEMFAFIFGHEMGSEPLLNGFSSNLTSIPFDEEFFNEAPNKDFNREEDNQEDSNYVVTKSKSQDTHSNAKVVTTVSVVSQSKPILTNFKDEAEMKESVAANLKPSTIVLNAEVVTPAETVDLKPIISNSHSNVKEVANVHKAKSPVKSKKNKKPVKSAKVSSPPKQKNNTAKLKYECRACHRIFYSGIQLENHLRNRKWCRRHFCRVCSVGFRGIEKLGTHVCGGKDGLYTCPHCKTDYRSAESLLRHTCENSQGTDDLSCFFCPRKFKKGYCWTNHVLRHVSENPNFTCPKCDTPLFLSPSSQIALFKQTKNNNFICKVCFETYKEKAPLLAHLKLEHKNYLKKVYKCVKCSRRYSYKRLVHEKRMFYRNSRN